VGPNFRVGQYVFEKPLGQGGMAEVWLARNVHLGTPAAIKFLNRAYAGVSEVEQRFVNEGRRQGLLSHPNIIKVYCKMRKPWSSTYSNPLRRWGIARRAVVPRGPARNRGSAAHRDLRAEWA
jgi:serine/threonine protein kinase